MAHASDALRRLLLAAPLASAGWACAAAGEPALPVAPVTGTSVWTVPGLELQYTLQPGADGRPVSSVLRSVVDVGGPRLRTDLRIDPTHADSTTRVSPLDLSLELPTAGPVRNLVVGDSYASGAGWSQPARMTGVRFGGAVTARAPLRTDGAIPVATPAFAAATRGLSEAGESALVDAKRLLPGAGSTAVAAPTPSDPTPLQAGTTDYDVEFGRLRDGWDTPDRTYLAEYGAAGYRAGLGGGLTAEARSEWTAAQNAHGVELLQDLGAGVSMHAVMARSAGADLSGSRWGMSVVRTGQGVAWRLDYAAADRSYRLITGATEAREGVRVGTSIALSRRATAEVSYVRKATWDAMPDSSMVLGTRIDLPRQAKVSFDVAVGTTNGEPSRRAGVSVSLPFEALRATP